MLTLRAVLETDTDILDALRAGETDRALNAFVRAHQGFVYAIAMRHLRDHEDARDVTQDVFVKALEALPRFTQQASLRTWLYRITVNACISLQRKRRWTTLFAFGEAEGEMDTPSMLPGTDARVLQSELGTFLQRILDTLPPKQRETFCLRYFDELSYEEISAMLGTSIGALKANYHWAVKKIAEQLRTSEYYEQWLEHTSPADHP